MAVTGRAIERIQGYSITLGPEKGLVTTIYRPGEIEQFRSDTRSRTTFDGGVLIGREWFQRPFDDIVALVLYLESCSSN